KKAKCAGIQRGKSVQAYLGAGAAGCTCSIVGAASAGVASTIAAGFIGTIVTVLPAPKILRTGARAGAAGSAGAAGWRFTAAFFTADFPEDLAIGLALDLRTGFFFLALIFLDIVDFRSTEKY